jgi:two-component system invasion response regulator UvrY
MQKKINVFICDDHLILIKGLKELINSDKRLFVSGFAQNSDEVKEIITANSMPIDVLLLDIKIQEQCGIQLARWLKETNNSIAILFLTMFEDVQNIHHAIEVGCSGYLPKNIDAEELKLAIKTVANGINYFPASIYKIIADQTEISNASVHPINAIDKVQLSERETEVLSLLLNGKKSKEISESLFLSIHTVNTYRKNLFKKFNVKNVTSLVIKAMKEYY